MNRAVRPGPEGDRVSVAIEIHGMRMPRVGWLVCAAHWAFVLVVAQAVVMCCVPWTPQEGRNAGQEEGEGRVSVGRTAREA